MNSICVYQNIGKQYIVTSFHSLINKNRLWILFLAALLTRIMTFLLAVDFVVKRKQYFKRRGRLASLQTCLFNFYSTVCSIIRLELSTLFAPVCWMHCVYWFEGPVLNDSYAPSLHAFERSNKPSVIQLKLMCLS